MAFRGSVADAFTIRDKGWVLNVQLSEGEPAIGDRVLCNGRRGQVVGLDDRGVQIRACLTGEPIVPQVMVAVIWEGEGEVPRRGDIASLPKEAPCSTAS